MTNRGYEESAHTLCVLSAANIEILARVLSSSSIDVALFWYHDELQLDESWSSSCRFFYMKRGYKLENFSVLLSEHPSILDEYSYILFVDDDLSMDDKTIDGFLSLVERSGLYLAHPALSFFSIFDNEHSSYLRKLPCLDLEFQTYLEVQMLAVHVSIIRSLQEQLSMFVTGYGFSRACVQALHLLYPESWKEKVGLVHRYSICHPYKDEAESVRVLYRDMDVQRDMIDSYLVSRSKEFPLALDDRGFPMLTSAHGVFLGMPVAANVVSLLRAILRILEKFKIAYYLEVVRQSRGACSWSHLMCNYLQWRKHFYLNADQTSLPDLPYKAIDALDSVIARKKGLAVLEVGAHSSVSFFCKRHCRVHAICFKDPHEKGAVREQGGHTYESAIVYSSLDSWLDDLLKRDSELCTRLFDYSAK